MATKTFGVNDALSNKLWSAKFIKEVHKRSYFSKFMGEGEDNIIQVKNETGKAPGDKITCGLVMSLTGDGVTEGGALEGNEEDLTTYDDSVLINELRHAVRVKNKRSIDQQRVPENLREMARNRLAQWWAMRMDTTMFLHLSGRSATSFSKDNQTVDPALAVYNGNNTITAPSSGRVIWSGSNSADEGLTSATDDRFILENIDECVLTAKTASPYISPINVGGEEKYVMFLHPRIVNAMRTDGSTSRVTWFDASRARLQGGESVKTNPIYSGALGEYNGVILHEAWRLPNGINSSSNAVVANTKRSVLCGRQAGIVAYGQAHQGSQRYRWTEELFDYQNQLGVGIDAVWGLKKCVFNSVDFGTVVLASYGAD